MIDDFDLQEASDEEAVQPYTDAALLVDDTNKKGNTPLHPINGFLFLTNWSSILLHYII